jgi:hypothetical protein
MNIRASDYQPIVRTLRLWHRVVTPRMERVTTSKPLDAQPSPFSQTVLGNGFIGVLRAARYEATGRGKRLGKSQLVKSNQSKGYLLHNVTINHKACVSPQAFFSPLAGFVVSSAERRGVSKM